VISASDFTRLSSIDSLKMLYRTMKPVDSVNRVFTSNDLSSKCQSELPYLKTGCIRPLKLVCPDVLILLVSSSLVRISTNNLVTVGINPTTLHFRLSIGLVLNAF